MTSRKISFIGSFINLKDGLLIFYSRAMSNWKDICIDDLVDLNPTIFENETINELFLTGLLENLKDLDTENGGYMIRFVFNIDLTQDKISKQANLGLKFIDKQELKKLKSDSKIAKFCQNLLDIN